MWVRFPLPARCTATYPYGGTVYAAVLEAVLRGVSSNLTKGTLYRSIAQLVKSASLTN